jgi:hypothetical protein
LAGGCRQEYEEEDVVPYRPLNDPNFTVPASAVRPIAASGGRQAWARVEKLNFDCVATFYQKDGSFYTTEQHHEIHPSLNSIRISATEPQGKFVWELSPDGFSTPERAEGADEVRTPAVNRNFAQAVLYITTAAVRLFDEGILLSKSSAPFRIEGLWYYPIEAIGAGGTGNGASVGEAVFYQNASDSLVDMVSFGDSEWQVFTVVRGYDYREVEKGSVLVPTKIEIFAAREGELLKERLARIDYHRMMSEE